MNTPAPAGTPINQARLDGWTFRFSSYRSPVDSTSISRWLSQFKTQDKDLAARVLDAVDYFGPPDVEAALAGALDSIVGWSTDENRRAGRWFLCPFSNSVGESGDTMTHTLRTAARLSGRRFDPLFIHRSELLSKKLTGADTVVFVDDFSGSGEQAKKAWNETLEELLPERPRVFLLLAASTEQAKQAVEAATPIQIVATRFFSSSDNYFLANCTHFTEAEKATTLAYCTKASRPMPRGWGDCGLLLVFAHKCPNNSLPILHSKSSRFRGLFPRS